MTILERLGVNRIVLALSVARLGDAIGNSILFIILPLYVAALPAPWVHVPESVRVGILISLYGFVNSGLQPLMGGLSDRIQRRKPFILGGLVLMGAGTFLFIFANRFVELVALRSLQGVGIAMTVPASMALMASATQKHTRGGSMGVYTTMRIVGFAVGPLLGGILHVHYGFTAAFLAGTAFLVVAMVLVQLWVTEAPARGPVAGGEPASKLGPGPEEGSVGRGESGSVSGSTPTEKSASARESVSAGDSTSAGERSGPQHETPSAGSERSAESERSAVRRRFTFLDRELLSSGIIGLGAATFVM
ncbi:MAG: MFS transporter, partial [bacterium]